MKHCPGIFNISSERTCPKKFKTGRPFLCLLFFFIALLLIPSLSYSSRLYTESVYRTKWCQGAGGEVGYILPDKTRVDCLLNDYVIEINFADQWAESIGKALYYANQTGRHPGVVFVSEKGEDDYKYLIRFLKAIEDSPKQWRLWIILPDIFIKKSFPEIPSLMTPIP